MCEKTEQKGKEGSTTHTLNTLPQERRNKMKQKMSSPIEKSITLGKEIEQSFKRWQDLNAGLNFDPFYEDGFSMNLVRNHILFYKKQIKDELPKELYPEAYYRPTPEKVDGHYIANQDTFIEKGEKRLLEIESFPLYKKLLGFHYPEYVSSAEDNKKNIFYYSVIGYVDSLKYYIQTVKDSFLRESSPVNPYLDLRRIIHYSDDWWNSSFQRCISSIEENFPDLKSKSDDQFTQIPHVEKVEKEVQAIEPAPTTPSKKKAVILPVFKEDDNTEYQFSFFDYGLTV